MHECSSCFATRLYLHGNVTMSNHPRYLFRTYSPGSDGYNSSMRFDSMAKANDLPATSLAEMSAGEARAMLKDHVLWTSWRQRNDDLLISFTSSFLFALQHAIRKSNVSYKSKCADCFIAMIDTTIFLKGTFTWTPTLLRTYGLDEDKGPNLRYSYHEAEYLAHYELLLLESGASTVTSLAELANKCELFRVLPGLAKDSKELVRALRDARRDWYQETRAISKSEIQQARNWHCASEESGFVR